MGVVLTGFRLATLDVVNNERANPPEESQDQQYRYDTCDNN